MIRTLLLLYFFCLSLFVFGQSNSITGKISETSGRAIEYANVTLIRLPDSLKVTAQMSDSLGQYSFKSIKKGDYVICASLLGYKEKFSDPFYLDSLTSLKIQLTLEEEYLESDEVIIKTDRPLVRQEPDKMVVDIENGVTNSGLSAIDVLRKSPGVSVDQDGKISIKGKRGVLVMIDDKPMYLSEEQVGNLLKSIPSDQIKEIEIITNPSAKYDAVGSAGIINIRLKKGAYEGLNGDINGSIGKGVYHKASIGANVTYKKKKVSINGGYQYSNKEELSDFYNHRQYINADNSFSRLNSDSYYRMPRNSHSLNFNSQYKLNSKSEISFDMNNAYSEYHWNGQSNSKLYNQDGSLNSSYINKDIGSSKPININTNLGYLIRPDTNGTIISTAINYNRNFGKEIKNVNIHYLDAENNDTGNPFLFSSFQHYTTDQASAKADLTKYVFKKSKWESGIKAIVSSTDYPVTISIIEKGILRDASNHFIYKEGVYAAYTMINKSIGKWKMQGGLRLENTQVEGTQTINDSTFKRNYTNLFPSGNLSYNATAKTSYTLMYSRRIQRPNAWQLNPILSIIDPYTYTGGNPYLLPQYTDKLDLAYSLFSGAVITTLGYAYAINPITWAVKINEKTQKAVGANINMKSQSSLGVSIAVNMPITKWWTTNNYAHVFNNKFIGDIGYGETTNQQVVWFANSTQTFKLPKKFILEVSGVYEPSGVYALSTSFTRWQANIGLQKKFWDNKASVKLAYSDLFWTYQYGGKATVGNARVENGYKWDNRVLMLTLSYKVGKRLILATS